MASAHVSPLPFEQRAVHFIPPTQVEKDDSALSQDCDDQAKISSAGAKASRLFSKKSGSGSFSGSFHAAKTPKMLFPQTPTPMAGAHPKFEWNSGSAAPQGAAGGPPTYAAAEPGMMPPPAPAPQMMWVPMPQQPLMMQMQAGVPAAPPSLAAPQNNAMTTVGNQDANAYPTLLGRSGLPSVGSAPHGTGRCQPCAWFWKAGRGCQDGANCDHCHLCPEGELKLRKKAKVQAMRMGLL